MKKGGSDTAPLLSYQLNPTVTWNPTPGASFAALCLRH